MIPSLQEIRKINLQKATQIRQNGYKSSIHALPSDVKKRLDELLAQRISPINVLRSLCDEFPKVDLPSAKAVENYRNKYHTQALVKQRALRKDEMANDITKQELERELLDNCYYLIKDLTPHLRKRIEIALEMEQKSGGLPLKITNEAVVTFIYILKVVQEIVSKNELWMKTQSKTIEKNEFAEDSEKENVRSPEELNKLLTTILLQHRNISA